MPSLHIKPCGVRCKLGKIFLASTENSATHFLFLLAYGSVYFSHIFGDGGVVAAGTGLSVLVCCDVAYKCFYVVVVQNLFELGE